MAFEIKNCSPITVILETGSASLESMRGLLPDAIEIVGKYSTTFSQVPVYLYKVLMPYKFNAPPDNSSFGDRTETVLKWVGDSSARGIEGSPVLAQDILYIHAYFH